MTPRLQEFMAALTAADGDAYTCHVPGLPGTWKVKHLRSGLQRGVLVNTGEIIAFIANPRHGLCENCAAHAKRGGRTECNHCNCSTCCFEREVDAHGGPRMTAVQGAELQRRIREFKFAPRRPIAALDEL